tara:strand:- start:3585 stop:3851 length:267 start_codon:yes stop_codon:yes gene_type:complete
MHKLILTASNDKIINSFSFCNKDELHCIITNINKDFLSGIIRLSDHSSIFFEKIEPDCLTDAFAIAGGKISEVKNAEEPVQFTSKIQF